MKSFFNEAWKDRSNSYDIKLNILDFDSDYRIHSFILKYQLPDLYLFIEKDKTLEYTKDIIGVIKALYFRNLDKEEILGAFRFLKRTPLVCDKIIDYIIDKIIVNNQNIEYFIENTFYDECDDPIILRLFKKFDEVTFRVIIRKYSEVYGETGKTENIMKALNFYFRSRDVSQNRLDKLLWDHNGSGGCIILYADVMGKNEFIKYCPKDYIIKYIKTFRKIYSDAELLNKFEK